MKYYSIGLLAAACATPRGSENQSLDSPTGALTPPVVKTVPKDDVNDGEVMALCTIRESSSGTVHRLEFLFNRDLGVYEVDHLAVDSDLQESFRSYFARGDLMKDRIAVDLQESVNGEKFAELRADAKGAKGLLIGTVSFTKTAAVERDATECSVSH